MSRLFRRYHRWLAIVCALPLLLTVMTGMTFPLAEALNQRQLASWLIHLHTLETFGLDAFFPVINGLGLLSLLVTGISMTSLIPGRRRSANSLESE